MDNRPLGEEIMAANRALADQISRSNSALGDRIVGALGAAK